MNFEVIINLILKLMEKLLSHLFGHQSQVSRAQAIQVFKALS